MGERILGFRVVVDCVARGWASSRAVGGSCLRIIKPQKGEKLMRRIITMTTFAVALTMLGLAYSQSAKTAAPKVGKVLVKSLPKGIEGVELAGGKVKVKSGYKFVKQSNGTVTVAKMA